MVNWQSSMVNIAVAIGLSLGVITLSFARGNHRRRRHSMKNALNWFEIPTTDFARAVAFYNTILAAQLETEVVGGIASAVFPYDTGAAIGGSLVHNPRLIPSADGAVIYLNCNGILDDVLVRVSKAGGRVLMPRTDIGFGSIAMMLDSEGNRVGLHSD
jgi:uncharacterized protein